MENANEQIQARIKQAAGAYLARKGYAVLATDFTAGKETADYIVWKENGVAIVTVSGKNAEGEAVLENRLSREGFEGIVFAFQNEMPRPNISVRADHIAITFGEEGRATLKHDTDILSNNWAECAKQIAGLLECARSEEYADGVRDSLRKLGYEIVETDDGYVLQEYGVSA